jgi:hypothetical protein
MKLHHSNHSAFCDFEVLQGDVVVARNPMTHAGDIRKLTAVRHEALLRLVSGSNGGVIFFSTKGVLFCLLKCLFFFDSIFLLCIVLHHILINQRMLCEQACEPKGTR